MSIHISALPGEIEKTILLAGDPLRAKYIAENYLQNIKQEVVEFANKLPF